MGNEPPSREAPRVAGVSVTSSQIVSEERALAARITHVVASMARRYGGPAFSVTGQAVAAQSAGFDVSVITTDLGAPPSWRSRARLVTNDLPPHARDVPIKVFPISRPRRLAYSRSLARAIDALVRDTHLVRIHSLWLFPQYAAFSASHRHAIPYVVSLHGALAPYLRRRGRTRKWITNRWWQEAMLENAVAIHVTTPLEAELTSDIAPRTPRIVIPNGIWIDDFTNLPDRYDSKVSLFGMASASKKTLTSIGRLARVKGIDRLLEAYALLSPRTRKDTLLTIAGPDDEGQGPMLRRLATRLGISDEVFFMGMVDPDKRRSLLAATDIWLLPSHTENFGIAALEALAAGCTVVVSPGVMLAPEIERNDAGIVVECTPALLAEVIEELVCNEGQRAALAAGGRRLAQRYDWLSISPLIEAAYRQNISSGL